MLCPAHIGSLGPILLQKACLKGVLAGAAIF